MGDTVIVAIAAQTGGAPTFTCSDSKSNVYSTDQRVQNGTNTTAICHAFIGTPLSTTDAIQVTIGGTPSGTCAYNVHALEFSNIRALNPVDATTAAGGNLKNANSGPITVSNRDAVIGVVAWNDSAGITGNGSWTSFVEVVGTTLTGVTEYVITAVSPQSASSTDANKHNFAAAVVGYLPP